jgi:hypothetical protein
VHLGSGLLLLGRAFTGVLDGQRRGEDEDLAETAVAVGLDHHATEPRIERQLRELAAERRQLLARILLGRVERTELFQKLDAVLDVAPVRRIDERERRDVTEPKRGHLQNDRGKVGAEDLRVGELGPRDEVIVAVEPDAGAVGHPPAAPLALVGRRLRDRLDRQPLDFEAVAVARDPRVARVDDVLDARNRQRGLGDVRRQYDAPPRMGLEHAVLLRRRQPRIERQHLGVPELRLAQSVSGIPDLPLTAEEHQDVARSLGAQLVHRFGDRLDLVADGVTGVGVRSVVQDRPVANLDRVGPAGHLDHRCVVEVPREPLRVDRRRRDDDLEVRPARQHLLEVAEDEVDVKAALVRLVDDQRVVLLQQPIALDLGEQDAVGHQLDERVVAHLVREPDLVADGATERRPQFLGDAIGYGPSSEPPRLRVADNASDAAAQLNADLRDLRGLPRAGLARDDHDLVVADGRQDVVLALTDRERFRIRDLGHAGRALREPLLRGTDVGSDLLDEPLPRFRTAYLPGPLDPALEPPLVPQHQARQAVLQIGERGCHERGSRRGQRVASFGPRLKHPAARDDSRPPDQMAG